MATDQKRFVLPLLVAAALNVILVDVSEKKIYFMADLGSQSFFDWFLIFLVCNLQKSLFIKYF